MTLSREQTMALLAGSTPGPWRVCIDDDGNPLSGRPSVQASDELDCGIVHWDGFVQAFWRSARGDKEIHANARLIASAPALAASHLAALDEVEHQRKNKDQAYEERNRLVALLASMFPSGIKRTDIPGWNPEWHGAVYIDFPWGQASWHYHDSQAHLFEHLPPYPGEWDGHTTEAKYDAIARAA